MTMRVYRFRARAPFDDATLATLTGDPVASVLGSTGGHIVDLLVDDSREDDLLEIMAHRDFEFIEADPVRMRTHDLFAGIEAPSRGSIVTAGDDFFITGRPMITDDEEGLIMIEDPEQGTIMLVDTDETGPGSQGGGGGGGFPVNEFDKANMTAIAKTLVYTGDDLTSVLLYADPAKTMLNYTKNLIYDMDGVLIEIELVRAIDAAVFTKTLSYTGDDLTSVVTEAA